MALTNQQDIPNKPEVKEPWTVRRLFPFAAVVSTLSKTFVNPFDVLLGYLVFVLGVAELVGRHVSWFLWILTVLILAVSVWEKQKPREESPKEK